MSDALWGRCTVLLKPLDLVKVLRLAAAPAQAIPISPKDLALLPRCDSRRPPITVIHPDEAGNGTSLGALITHQAVHNSLVSDLPYLLYLNGLVLSIQWR